MDLDIQAVRVMVHRHRNTRMIDSYWSAMRERVRRATPYQLPVLCGIASPALVPLRAPVPRNRMRRGLPVRPHDRLGPWSPVGA